LREYINNISDSTTLRDYINKEIPILKKKLDKGIKECDDEITKIKLQEVAAQLPNYLKGRIIKDSHILTLMRYYELVKSLEEVHNETKK